MSEWGEDKPVAEDNTSNHSDTGAEQVPKPKIDPEAAKAADAERVRDAQWTEPQKYDYDAYNAKGKEEIAESELNLPDWAHGAVKYEWSDEYGDVGPEFKELERALFGDDTKTSKGDQYAK